MKRLTLIANFGGPRSLNEIESFLCALLTDKDVVRTKLPQFLHNRLFSRVAKKRALKIAADYALIGGGSPIYDDTEALAELLEVQGPLLTFHRYLPATHQAFFKALQKEQFDEIVVFPLFPQFSFATTGSIARFFLDFVPQEIVQKMRWVKSYCEHPAYVQAFEQCIRDFLRASEFKEEETVLLFSAHGVPQSFVQTGDIYQTECQRTFDALAKGFPKALNRLSYQSKFGRGEWLRPYTDEVCQDVLAWTEGRKQVVFVPLSFTSDHVETLFEVQYQYVPLIEAKGLIAKRCPALNLRPDWIKAVRTILQEPHLSETAELVRR